jgi:hypothetical protein
MSWLEVGCIFASTSSALESLSDFNMGVIITMKLLTVPKASCNISVTELWQMTGLIIVEMTVSKIVVRSLSFSESLSVIDCFIVILSV